MFTIQGQLRAFREDVSMRHKTETGPDHVLMVWMVRRCAWVVNNFQVKGTGENALSFYLEQGLRWRSSAICQVGCEEFLSASLTAPMNFCC